MTDQPTDQVPVAESSVEATGGTVGLTPLGKQYLDQTQPWVRLISIITFVMAGFMVLVGIGVLAFSVVGGLVAKNRGEFGAFGSAMFGAGLALVYVVLAFVYIAPGVYLYRYAGAIRRLMASGGAAALEDALKHQKSFWRFVGILMVIGLVVSLVVMIVAFVAGVIAAVMAARS